MHRLLALSVGTVAVAALTAAPAFASTRVVAHKSAVPASVQLTKNTICIGTEGPTGQQQPLFCVTLPWP